MATPKKVTDPAATESENSSESAPTAGQENLLDLVVAHAEDNNARMTAFEEGLAGLQAQMATLITVMTKTHDPAKGYVEPEDLPIHGAGTAFEFNDRGLAVNFSGGPPLDVDSPEFKAKMDMAAFMNQKVKIKMHQPQDPQAQQRFAISINGVAWWFGGLDELAFEQVYTVPRYVVSALLQTRPFTYRNEEFVRSDGTKAVKYPRHVAMRYQFTVLEDPAGRRGAEWYAQTMRRG